MTLRSIIATDFGQAAHSYFIALGTGQKSSSLLQGEFMGVLTTYFPVTFDKLRSMTEKDVHVTFRELIDSRWPYLRLLRQHPD